MELDHAEMATERTDEVRGLVSQQEGIMWSGGKSGSRQHRLPGR